MDRPTVYIETSIVSYLAAHPSRDPVTLRNQQLTHTWWNNHRHNYELFTSELVMLEAERGDPVTAARRVALLSTIQNLPLSSDDIALARGLQLQVPLPSKAQEDALHIAAAARRGMAYLLTWDRKHIANPQFEARIRRIVTTYGYSPAVMCTPEHLLEKA